MTLQMVLKDTLLNGDRRNKALLSSRKKLLESLTDYIAADRQTDALCPYLSDRDIPSIDTLLDAYLGFKGTPMRNISLTERLFPFQPTGGGFGASFREEGGQFARLNNPKRMEFINALIDALNELGEAPCANQS